VKAIEADTIRVLLARSEWELLKSLADARRMWIEARMLSTHAYILRRNMFPQVIGIIEANVALPLDEILPIDVLYQKELHGVYNCYALVKPVAKQIPSYSNIQGSYTDYRKLHEYSIDRFPVNHLRGSFRAADTKNDGKTLCLDHVDVKALPTVSVLTITRNHPREFALPVYTFMNFDYPAHLLQWVIVDDSDKDHDLRPSLGALRKDPRVKHIRLESKSGAPFSVGFKRQVACSKASGQVFYHLDDDDHHPPVSMLARVKAMLTYNARCMGSTNILCYDIEAKEVLNWPSGNVFGDRTIFPEAGMAYTREFGRSRAGRT
jgi:hypothetical protein